MTTPKEHDIMWFDKDSSGTLFDPKTQSYVVILPSVPDYVKLPAELGGHTARVLSGFKAQCPQRCGFVCTHYKLENDLYVANCNHCTNPYGWYQKKG